METKFCPQCKKTLPIEQFHIRKPNGRHKKGYRTPCKVCIRNRPKKSQPLIYKGHKLEQSQAQALIKDKVCAICKVEAEVVDHDHSNGKLREPLCSNCNRGLGCFDDDPYLLEKAAAYVRKHSRI